jgi:D-inositol-3-phosphate glycosyltransferase
MRIAIVSEHASPLAALGGVDAGGQNAHVAELAAALVRRGHEVRVYTRRDDPGQPETVCTADGVEVVHVPAGPAEPVPKDRLLPYMAAFGDWLCTSWRSGSWTPDVVHAHFWMSGLAGLTAARQLDVPVVLTYHALGFVKRRHQGAADTSPPARIGFERLLGRTVDRVVAQCSDEVDELVRSGVPRRRIVVVPSGVDLDRFTPEGPSVPRTARRPRVLVAGRLVPRKGLREVIRAMHSVPAEAELVVLGGPPADGLAGDSLARELFAGGARMIGAVPRNEMPMWYRSADVVVSAPWYEPFGLTPLEAMACGVAFIGTAVGGLTDTVVDGVTGDLVPPRDPEALGQAIRRLLGDPMRRHAYGAAGLDRVRSAYSWSRTASRLEAVYDGVRAKAAVG